MSDLSVSSAASSVQQAYSAQQSQWSQVKNLFSQLGQALQKGDLKGAQAAFASLQSLLPPPPQDADAKNAQGTSQNPMAALATALQNGDLAGAQQAFSQLQQTQGHHHHHHHHGGAQGASSTPSPAPTSTANSPTIAINGSNDTVIINQGGSNGTGGFNATA